MKAYVLLTVLLSSALCAVKGTSTVTIPTKNATTSPTTETSTPTTPATTATTSPTTETSTPTTPATTATTSPTTGTSTVTIPTKNATTSPTTETSTPTTPATTTTTSPTAETSTPTTPATTATTSPTTGTSTVTIPTKNATTSPATETSTPTTPATTTTTSPTTGTSTVTIPTKNATTSPTTETSTPTTPATTATTSPTTGTSTVTIPTKNATTSPATETSTPTTPATTTTTSPTTGTSTVTIPTKNATTSPTTETSTPTTPATTATTSPTTGTPAPTTPTSIATTAATTGTSTVTIPTKNATTSPATETSTPTTPATTTTTSPTTGTSTPTTSVSTATTAPTTGTPAPASPDNTTSSTPPAAGPPTCEHNPCGNSAAQCITLYQNYTCQCPFQFYYNSSACVEGKVFPGQLTVNIGYSSEMQNVNSPKYIEVYQAIENFFQKAFSDRLDYGQTVIETLRGLSSARKRSTNPTEVTFMNIFEAKTTLSNETVAELITKVNGGDQIDSKSYKPLSECAVYGCDLVTTTCQALPDGLLVCKCKDGAFKKNQEDRVCSYCRSTCTSENNEHCTYNKTGFPVCSCLPDFKSQGSKCVACPVGYSGVECESNFLLIVIILACVLGAAILILLSVVIYLSVRTTRKSDPEKKRLLNLTKQNAEEISNGSSGSNMEAGGRIFPRIKTNVGRANQGFEGSNPYVANPPNRNYLPEKDYDYDDDYEMSARGDGFKLQRRS
ncbi:mucin-13 isoform X5 [Alligator mississippiensis]|uniref:mucin-13 isoform X5 n=1 Tax=Alligator mississippiensis TaxID=8496 RepID=UPI002877F514|nr:mucin-13 isoform X5 [Alligator mississippiensis]